MAPEQRNQPGTLPSPDTLVDVPRLITAYYALHPDPDNAAAAGGVRNVGASRQRVHVSFNDDHIAAITQAIVDYRHGQRIGGPLFLAKDTHALSEPAFATALEVLAANGIDVMVDDQLAYTPTPALLACDSDLQRGEPRQAAERWHRDYAVAQSARGWRLQIQPAQRRPGGYYGDEVDRESRESVDLRTG